VIDEKRLIEAPKPPKQPSPAAGLMEALERTLDEVRSGC
jgi:hypothetical protein